MDRPRLAKFLVHCYDQAADREARLRMDLTCELYCPNGWHVPD
jgi:hypothetical protein